MLEITEIPCTLDQGADEEGCLEAGTRETCRLLGIQRSDILRASLRRKSIDARKRRDVRFTLSIRLELAEGFDEAAAA